MEINPDASMNVFFHKNDLDFYNEDKNNDATRILVEAIESTLDPAININKNNVKNKLVIYNTSIYDPSILESMSKIISKLIGEKFPHLNIMMNDISSTCNLDKVYLFDMITKVFFATDFVPLDTENFALCADMLDVYMDFSCIYGDKSDETNEDNSYKIFYEQLIKLTDKKILFLQEIQGHVTLMCCFHEDYLDRKGVIEYNIKVFRETFHKMITKEAINNKR